MNDLISVLIPAYNHENYVQESIQSIIDQTYNNIELIVLDDGSKDSTWAKINELQEVCEKRFSNVLFKTKQNQGSCETINQLIDLAQGEYVLIVASDDKLLPNAIEILHNFLSQNQDYSLAVGKNLIVDGEGKECYWDKNRENVYSKDEAAYLSFTDWLVDDARHVDFHSDDFGSYESLLKGNYVPNGYLIRKNIYEKIGRYTPAAPLEDWWLMLQVAKYAKLKYIDEPTFLYRWHGGNTMSNRERIKQIMRQTEKYELTLVEKSGPPEIKKIVKEFLKTKDGKSLFKIPLLFELNEKDDGKKIRFIVKLLGSKISIGSRLKPEVTSPVEQIEKNEINTYYNNLSSEKVSVIIPCYNQGEYLQEAVDSVLASTHKNIEIIVIDDGSTKDVDLIDAVKCENVKIIHQKNQGVCIARNHGIKEATGKYILPLDADDKIYPTYIEKALNVMTQNPKFGIVYCNAEFFGSKTGIWKLEDYSFPEILISNMIFSSAMFRKSDWQKVGGYNPIMDSGYEDWEFWLSLIETGLGVFKIPEALFLYRQYEDTRTCRAEANRLALIKKIMRLHPNLYIDNFEKVIIPFFHIFVLKNSKKELFSFKLRTKFFGKMFYAFLEKNYEYKIYNGDVKVSILTASYNYENYIKGTIESVLAQTYTNWELVIVDDGSTDNSVEVIKEYCKKDSRIKLYTHPNNENKGLAQTLKLGLSKCEGDWVAFLESDDLFTPESIEKKVKIAEQHPDVSIVFSDVEQFGNQDIIKRDEQFFKDMKYTLKKMDYPADISIHMFKDNLIQTFSAVMVKKTSIEKCDFNCPIKACLDWYLWAQLVNEGVYYIDEKLTKWRRHQESYIHTVDTLPTEFRIAISKKIIKNNKYLWFKFIKYFKRKFIRFHLFTDPQVWIFEKPLIKKK